MKKTQLWQIYAMARNVALVLIGVGIGTGGSILYFKMLMRVDKVEVLYLAGAVCGDACDAPKEAKLLVAYATINHARHLQLPIMEVVKNMLPQARDGKVRRFYKRQPLIALGIGGPQGQVESLTIAVTVLAGVEKPPEDLLCVEFYTRDDWPMRTDAIDRAWFSDNLRLATTISGLMFYCRK